MKIELTGKYSSNKTALVDADDYEKLVKYNWHVTDKGYARRALKVNGRQRSISMHRQVLDYSGDLLIDHINDNKLDNRKSNLRVVTSRENNRHNKKRYIDGIKGTNVYKSGNSFSVKIGANGKPVHVRNYENYEEALIASEACQILIRKLGL